MTFDKSKLGLVHIYTGEGKGKTSAGMGLVLRALGRGLKIKIIQLFKRDTGEQFFLNEKEIEYSQFKFLHPYFKKYNKEEFNNLKKEIREFLKEETQNIENYDLILIDELGPGIKEGLIDEKTSLDIIKNKPKNTELVLTGRDFPISLIEKADYVSEILKKKHPYDKGILAREGIEY
jgi:cob(I)alamin adenosyltransferase